MKDCCRVRPGWFSLVPCPGVLELRWLEGKEEATCVAFREHTLLPLDDCLYTPQENIPTVLTDNGSAFCYPPRYRHGEQYTSIPHIRGDEPNTYESQVPILL